MGKLKSYNFYYQLNYYFIIAHNLLLINLYLTMLTITLLHKFEHAIRKEGLLVCAPIILKQPSSGENFFPMLNAMIQELLRV